MSPKAPRTVIDGLAFAEGIRFVGGRLWLSDMHDRRVYCVDPTTGEVLAEHLTPRARRAS